MKRNRHQNPQPGILAALPLVATTLLIGACVTVSGPAGAEQKLPLDEDWELLQSATVTSHDGAPALRFESGRAIQPEVDLENGTIELEMMTSGLRSFVYLQFRLDEKRTSYEEIYFRSHKSHAPDALQYTPVDRGISAWQLYHGKGKTAAVALPPDEWIPVKLVVEGTRAAVFVGETGRDAQPALVISRLARAPRSGAIALRGFVARGSTAPYSALFRNVRIDKERIDYDFSQAPEPASAPAGTIAAWKLGQSFAPEALTFESLTEVPEPSRKPYLTVEPDVEGLVNIGRDLARPQAARAWATVASVTLDAESATRQRLDLGYSDAVSVFLNGELLFTADDSYQFDLPRRQGLIGLFQASLYLPLDEGPNRLEIVVADRFGGWGLMGRLAGEGVTVRP